MSAGKARTGRTAERSGTGQEGGDRTRKLRTSVAWSPHQLWSPQTDSCCRRDHASTRESERTSESIRERQAHSSAGRRLLGGDPSGQAGPGRASSGSVGFQLLRMGAGISLLPREARTRGAPLLGQSPCPASGTRASRVLEGSRTRKHSPSVKETRPLWPRQEVTFPAAGHPSPSFRGKSAVQTWVPTRGRSSPRQAQPRPAPPSAPSRPA